MDYEKDSIYPLAPENTGQPPVTGNTQPFAIESWGWDYNQRPNDSPMLVDRQGSLRPFDTAPPPGEDEAWLDDDVHNTESSPPSERKHKKKHKKKHKGSKTSVSLLDLAAYHLGSDSDDDPEDDLEPETEPSTWERTKQPPVADMARELSQKVPIKFIEDQGYFYNGLFYEPFDREKTLSLYRTYVQPNFDGAKNLRNHMDIYAVLNSFEELKLKGPLDDRSYCPLKNGILYLDTMKLKPHKQKRITFTCLDAKYDRDAQCPVFDEFLDTITGGREDLKERMMMAIGYLLTEPPKGKFFLVAGYAANSGKSVLGNFIQRLYPRDVVSNLSLGELGDQFETEALLTSMINISLDLPDEVLNTKAVSRLKRITGGDTWNVPRKYKSSQRLDRNLKFFFA